MGKPVVWYIDDNPAEAPLLDEAAAEVGFDGTLVWVRNGILALRRLREIAPGKRPDLILLDLNMPEMPGEEVLRQLKADEDLASIPVIVFSTAGSEADFIRSAQLGAVAHLPKPVEWDGYLMAIRRLERECHRLAPAE